MSVSPNWDWASPGNFAVFDYAASSSIARNPATVATAEGRHYDHGEQPRYDVAESWLRAGPGEWQLLLGLQWACGTKRHEPHGGVPHSNDAKYLRWWRPNKSITCSDVTPSAGPWFTGLGYAPPVYPHHRPSTADRVRDPWPGLLVGGPNKSSSDAACSAYPDTPVGKYWHDNSSDYCTNEIAINWNGALVYALAGFVR